MSEEKTAEPIYRVDTYRQGKKMIAVYVGDEVPTKYEGRCMGTQVGRTVQGQTVSREVPVCFDIAAETLEEAFEQFDDAYDRWVHKRNIAEGAKSRIVMPGGPIPGNGRGK